MVERGHTDSAPAADYPDSAEAVGRAVLRR